MALNSPGPSCPFCRAHLDPKTDLLWDNTGQLKVGGVSIVYCGYCGAVLGGAPFTTFTKRQRG